MSAAAEKLARIFVRLALRTWPAALRDLVADETTEATARGLRKRIEAGGFVVAASYLLAVCFDVVRCGWKERVRRRPAIARPRLDGLDSDIRCALRRARREPGFIVTVLLLIALGVGANAAVFGAVKAVLLSPPPLPDAGTLGLVRTRTIATGNDVYGDWSPAELRDLHDATTDLFVGLTGYTLRAVTITDPGNPEHVGYELVTPGYFATLGLRPAAGRFFAGTEDGLDEPTGVAVISHGLWLQRYGGDPAAVGRALWLQNSRLTIIGVAPPDFDGLSGSARLWVPLGVSRDLLGDWVQRRDIPWLSAIARRDTARAPAVVNERLVAIGESVTAAAPRGDGNQPTVAAFTPLEELWIPDATRSSLRLAMGAALAVLLIVVVNLSALILLSERRRARGTAMRFALGASRWDIVRGRLVEATMLTLVGGALGLAIAWLSITSMAGLWPSHTFRASAGYLQLVDAADISIDATIVAVGMAMALLTTLLATVVPVLVSSRRDAAAGFEQKGTTPPAGRRHGGAREWLLGGQIALATALLATFGLLAATLLSLQAAQRGFAAQDLLVLSYSLVGRPAAAEQEASKAFHADLRQRLEALPGVVTVSMATSAPLASGFVTSRLEAIDGQPVPEAGAPALGAHLVDERYFGTLETRFELGRGFTAAEVDRAEPVVVVSRSAADTFFGATDPIGRTIRFAFPSPQPRVDLTVIGVIEDILYRAPTEGFRPEVFVPIGFWAPPGLTALVRTAVPPQQVVPQAREALAALDAGVAYSSVRTGAELRATGVAAERAIVILVGLFAALAVFLSMAGLWATVARSVAERRREIGVRMAIGARAGGVRRMFLGQCLIPVLGGAAAGLVAATVASHRLEDLLFGVEGGEPWVLLGAGLALIAVSLLATWLPARAISRIDPAEALSQG